MRSLLDCRRGGLVALAIIAAAVPGITARPAGAESTQTAAGITVIRYFSNRGMIATFEMADALGWLKAKGIRIESQGYSQSGPENLVGLASGSVDVAGAATAPVINAIVGGAKIIGVLPDVGTSKSVNSKFFVLADSPIRTAQDLKNRSIAVNTLGAHLDYTSREYLRNHGLHNDDVQLISIPGPQLDQILRHKQADVVAVGAWQTIFAGKIEAEGGVRVLYTDYDVLGNIVLGSDVMEKAFIDKHPQAVRDFVTAAARTVDWSEAHPADAKKLFAEILAKRGDNPDLAQYWTGYGVRRHALYTDHDARFWLDVMVREGRITPGQYKPDDILTNKYNAFAED